MTGVRRFPIALGLIALAAVAGRLVYTIWIAPSSTGLNDTFWYRVVADGLSAGRGFVTPVGGFTSGFHFAATAQHPPAYPVVLAGLNELGIHGDTAQRSLGAILGGISVFGIGIVGRRIAGETAGLLAAGLAAAYPLLIVADGALLSETLYGPIVVLMLLLALRLAERPSAGRAAALGAAIGLATLTRSEALFLLPLLALPLAWRGGGSGRLLRLGAAGACMVLVLTPWVIRNWAAFDRPLLSTDDGTTLAWTNCDSTYHGPLLGYKDISCAPVNTTGDEAEEAAKLRKRGIDYAKDHASRLPVVAAARLLGTWSIFHPFRVRDPGRPTNVVRAGIVYFYVLVLLAIGGAIALRRQRTTLLILLAPFVVVSLTAMASYSSLRGRYLAEIPLVLLAACGIDALRRRSAGARTG